MFTLKDKACACNRLLGSAAAPALATTPGPDGRSCPRGAGAAGTDVSMHRSTLVDLILEYVQIVGGCHGDDVVEGVPGGVKDLLVKVQTVDTDLVLLALPACADSARFEDRPRFAVLSRRLQGDVVPVVSVKHPEEVVVGACHHNAAERREKDVTGRFIFE